MQGTMIVIGSLLVVAGYLIFNYFRMKNLKLVPDSEKILTLTDKNFQHQLKNGVHLVDFWAAWCAPCKIMAPILNEIAEESDNRFRIAKLNVEQYPSAAGEFKVRNIPTMILFKDGKEVKRFVGVKPKHHLVSQITAIVD